MNANIELPAVGLESDMLAKEICQRFVRLSCYKMASTRGSGNHLRRNLLILHLLRKARNDMQL